MNWNQYQTLAIRTSGVEKKIRIITQINTENIIDGKGKYLDTELAWIGSDSSRMQYAVR